MVKCEASTNHETLGFKHRVSTNDGTLGFRVQRRWEGPKTPGDDDFFSQLHIEEEQTLVTVIAPRIWYE